MRPPLFPLKLQTGVCKPVDSIFVHPQKLARSCPETIPAQPGGSGSQYAQLEIRISQLVDLRAYSQHGADRWLKWHLQHHTACRKVSDPRTVRPVMGRRGADERDNGSAVHPDAVMRPLLNPLGPSRHRELKNPSVR